MARDGKATLGTLREKEQKQKCDGGPHIIQTAAK